MAASRSGQELRFGITGPTRRGRASLPVPRTRLLGRGPELAQARALLGRPDVGLLTLTGAPGSGKTRLALEIAATLADGFTGGVVFVPLAPLTDAERVGDAVAAAVELREGTQRSVTESLIAYFANKHALVVLDNFEHVLAAAPLVGMLLARCPGLKVLATSRAALHLSGEHELPVLPLSVPALGSRDLDTESGHDAALVLRLLDYPSVELFCHRATAVNPAFVLDAENGRAVAAICGRLDGLPLAIELAAARMKLLTPRALLGRLNSRLAELTGGARDLPARQQTLRDTLAWSYELLDAEERSLLRSLAVFAGGCTLEAAEAVSGGLDPLDQLASLVDKSLLRGDEPRTVDGSPRLVMLETIREFGLEQLAAHDETVAVGEWHTAYFLAEAEAAAPALRGPEQQRYLERLSADHDNLRAALSRSIEGGQSATALRLCRALTEFWQLRGHFSEGRQWLGRTLALSLGAGTVDRAWALHGIAVLAGEQGDHPAASARGEEALALFRALEEPAGIAASLATLGRLACLWGRHAEAQSRLAEALAIFRALDDSDGAAGALNWLSATAWRQGDYAAARPLLEETLALARRIGNQVRAGTALNGLGVVEQRLGNVVAARAHYEETLEINRSVGDQRGTAAALLNLGSIDLQEGDLPAALARLDESRVLWEELGDQARSLDSLLQVAITREQLGDAGRARAAFETCVAGYRDLEHGTGLAYTLRHAGEFARRRGDLDAARAMHEESLACFRELGQQPGIAIALRTLGDTLRYAGDAKRARGLCADGLRLAHTLGDRRNTAAALEGLAALDQAREPGRAAFLLAAAAALRTAIRTPVPAVDRAEYDQRLDSLRMTLGRESFDAAWAEGGSAPVAAAVSLARARPSARPNLATGSDKSVARPGGLSEREDAVLRLLAAGRTNREIAATLGLSPGTIQRHVANIYVKIEARGRAGATAYAIQHGLHSAAPA